MNEIDVETSNYVSNVVKSFSPGIRCAFAYGSGVFKQIGHASMKDNMMDFIFVVNDAFSWHYQTLMKYPQHYSFLKGLGPNFISKLQTNYGAKVYFNTCVEFEHRLIKYGVIELKDFINDLQNWESLYIAGRLHKPVLCLKGFDDPAISNAITLNLRSAVEASLLTLPECFSEEELYMCIAGLSYSGDPRMIIGEDKKKVQNIVLPSMIQFRSLYKNIVTQSAALNFQNGIVEQNISPEVQGVYIKRLPLTLKSYICRQFGVKLENITSESIDITMKEIAGQRSKCREASLKGIQSIVRKTSTTQTVKGFATSGLNKSIFYSLQKLKKMLNSLR